MQHQDQWLNAVLAGMNIGRTDNAGGLSSLAEAINASKLGNYSKAKKAAQFAALKFQKSGLIAGLFRADFEGIYASQLLQQGQNCYGARVCCSSSCVENPTTGWKPRSNSNERSVQT